MTYSGLIKDENARGSLAGSYPRRVIMYTAFAAVMGWAFSTYMPQLGDMAWRFALGLGMAIALVLMVTNVSDERGQRMFGGLLMGAAFVVGMWGLWIDAQYGTIPTVAQLQDTFAGQSYALQTFGEPFEVRGYIFEMWVGITALFAGIPILAGLAKPRTAGTRANPFSVHADFAQPFLPRLIFMPLVSFGIAAGAVYAFPYLMEYDVPVQTVWLPPLIAGFLYAKLHMTFPKALMVSLVGGIAGAAGFWLPWLYQTAGQDGMIAFISGAPQEILARAQQLASEYGYVVEMYGSTTDYSPWTFEIWAGLTLTYLGMPLLVTLCRRFMYFIRLA